MYCRPLGVVNTPFTVLLLARNASPALRFLSATALASACLAAVRRAEKAERSVSASASPSSGLPAGSEAALKPARNIGMSNSPLIAASERPMSEPTSRPTLLRSTAAPGWPPLLRALMLAISACPTCLLAASSSRGLPPARALSTPRWNAAMSMSGTAGATDFATSMPIM